jgi:hypothetical protein
MNKENEKEEGEAALNLSGYGFGGEAITRMENLVSYS